MSTAYLTRVVSFTAQHRYFRPEWTAERNVATFGTAGADHGHTYQCAVTVKGTPDAVTGMVVDLAILDGILNEEIVGRFDQRHINRDVPEYGYGRVVPTGEMLCLDVWQRVAARLPSGCSLSVVRVQEDASLYSEYRGE